MPSSRRCAIRRNVDGGAHLLYPFAGSRMLRDLLRQEGTPVGRLHVATLMKRMGLEAIYRRPNTSKPAPGHKIYPYLLRKLAVTRPNQVWATDLLRERAVPVARLRDASDHRLRIPAGHVRISGLPAGARRG